MMSDRMNDLLRGSSLDPAHLYVECEACRLAGREGAIARDPFDDGMCVYGHPLGNDSQTRKEDR